MKTILLFSAVCLICNISIAQNLIINPSFEEISKHDNEGLDMKYCSGWDISIRAGISSTPDHVIANDTNNYPQSSQGPMSAHTGNCFAGMTQNEYLITVFNNQMEKDSLYRISFWLCFTPKSDFYSKNIQYRFLSENSFGFFDLKFNDIKKQLLLDSLTNDFSHIKLDSSAYRKWHLIQFLFRATGNERGFMIGFKNNIHDHNVVVCQESYRKMRTNQAQMKQLYYYLDDFSIEKTKAPLVIGKPLIAKDILFETNKSDLDPKSFIYLKNVAEYLLATPNVVVIISGYTDNYGLEKFNMDLSLARAESVKKALVFYGVSSDRISVKGYGSKNPVSNNSTPEGRANNRRIELLIQ